MVYILRALCSLEPGNGLSRTLIPLVLACGSLDQCEVLLVFETGCFPPASVGKWTVIGCSFRTLIELSWSF